MERNGYGRQMDSRVAEIDRSPTSQAPGAGKARGRFHSRADYSTRRAGVKVLARYQGNPVLVEQGRHLAATFHPELTRRESVHRRFLDKL